MTYENFGNSGYPQVEAAGSSAHEDAYERASWRATFGGDVASSYREGQQIQQGHTQGGQWRATYGGDVGNTFRAGVQNENSAQWRKSYGSDVGQTFRPGVMNENSGEWRHRYGSDVGQTFRPGVMNENSGDWRQRYGSDVGQTFRPGVQNDGTGQWRPGYGSDVGQTFVPGNGNGTGYVDNSGQWRDTYGDDVGQTFVPGVPGAGIGYADRSGYLDKTGQWVNAGGVEVVQNVDPNKANYIEPWRFYHDDSLRIGQNSAAQSYEQYAQLDNYRRTDGYALDPSQFQQFDQMNQFDRAGYQNQQMLYDRYGRPLYQGNDYSYNFDARDAYIQQMMLRQILGMIHNHGGRVNIYRGGYGDFDPGYHHQHRHSHRQQAPRFQFRINV
ncbi:MAG: hypothetical protein C0507_18985 [Cyanobacteria bacterium PR.3.49]|nr:hypothetical protein [Cyanobacteria bacterium PR.3.49]